MGGVSCVCQLIKEASQSLLPVGGKSNGIIFVRGVYLDENTSQSASLLFQKTPPRWAASPAFFYQ